MNVINSSIHSKVAWAVATGAVVIAAGVSASSFVATADEPGCDLAMSEANTASVSSVGGLARTQVITGCELDDPNPVLNGAGGTDGMLNAEPQVEQNRYDIYGDCTISTDPGTADQCVAPLSIVTHPACQGSVDDLLFALSGLVPAQRRGVRVVSRDDGRTLHIATGQLTVAIFADTAARADAAFLALRGPGANPAGNLEPEVPAPAPGTETMCVPSGPNP